MQPFETVVVDTDLLILGGGMSACGAAFERLIGQRNMASR